MARQQESVDELFEIKNSLYIGNFQQCINEAQKLKLNDADVLVERDIFLYRAYLAQGKCRIVMEEIHGASSPRLQPLKLWAEYITAGNKDVVVSKLDDILTRDIDSSNDTLFIVAGYIYIHEQNYDAALRILHQADSLEASALTLQTLLLLERTDLAKKELAAMQAKDEDATLTQLAQAWLNIQLGGNKCEDAFYIFQEMIDKYGSTVFLLTCRAACLIHLGRYEEANSTLQECTAKDPNNAEALINLIKLSPQKELANRCIIQLQESHPSHIYIKELATKEAEFDRLAKTFSTACNV